MYSHPPKVWPRLIPKVLAGLQKREQSLRSHEFQAGNWLTLTYTFYWPTPVQRPAQIQEAGKQMHTHAEENSCEVTMQRAHRVKELKYFDNPCSICYYLGLKSFAFILSTSCTSGFLRVFSILH